MKANQVLTRFDYYLVDGDNVARVWRIPFGCAGPVECYAAPDNRWHQVSAVSRSELVSNNMRPLPAADVASEIRVCRLISRAINAAEKYFQYENQKHANN